MVEPSDELIEILERRPPPRRRVYPKTYGKPPGALQIERREVTAPERRRRTLVAQQITGEAEEREFIELSNGVVALKVAARDFVFVDAEDVATVAAYRWSVRAINSFNGHYRGLATYWDETLPNGVVLRRRMWLHDLLLDTPFWTEPAIHELPGPRWIVEHGDYNGMNCTRANLTLVESPDGFVEVPQLNLPVGVWWNYRRHNWTGRVLGEGAWYVDLPNVATFEEAAGHYFKRLAGWSIVDRRQARYAHGTPIAYRGEMYSLAEWQTLRAAEKEDV